MFVESKNVTIGGSVKIIIERKGARIEGDVPLELIDAETKFNDPKAAKVNRVKNFNADQDKNKMEALLHADFQNGKNTRGRSFDGNGMEYSQSKAIKDAKKAKNDNYIHLFDKETKEFPAGLLNKVTEVLNKEGISFSVEDNRPIPVREFGWSLLDIPDKKPREYQIEGANLTDVHKTLLFDWATNSGKTLLMSMIAAKKGVRTLILTHSGHLAYQIRDCIEEFLGIKPTISARGKANLSPITVAVINTARNQIADIIDYGFELVMVDEAHRSAAQSYVKVLRHLNPAYSYGFTGTAFRHGADGLVLDAIYGDARPKISNLEMIEKGFSCKVEIEFTEVDQSDECNKLDPYDLVYKNGIVNSPIFNASVIESIVKHAELGRVLVVQVAQKAQGKLIYFALQDFGIKSVLVDGDNLGQENYKRLTDFKAGKYQVAIGTVINEGFDHDGLDVVVNAAGYKAVGLTKQKLGRVLRIRDGKEKGFYVDFYSLGHPVLEKHSRKRAEALEAEGFKVDILEVIRKREAAERAKVAKEQTKANDKFEEVKKNAEKATRGIVTSKSLGKSGFVKMKQQEVNL